MARKHGKSRKSRKGSSGIRKNGRRSSRTTTSATVRKIQNVVLDSVETKYVLDNHSSTVTHPSAVIPGAFMRVWLGNEAKLPHKLGASITMQAGGDKLVKWAHPHDMQRKDDRIYLSGCRTKLRFRVAQTVYTNPKAVALNADVAAQLHSQDAGSYMQYASNGCRIIHGKYNGTWTDFIAWYKDLLTRMHEVDTRDWKTFQIANAPTEQGESDMGTAGPSETPMIAEDTIVTPGIRVNMDLNRVNILSDHEVELNYGGWGESLGPGAGGKVHLAPATESDNYHENHGAHTLSYVALKLAAAKDTSIAGLAKLANNLTKTKFLTPKMYSRTINADHDFWHKKEVKYDPATGQCLGPFPFTLVLVEKAGEDHKTDGAVHIDHKNASNHTEYPFQMQILDDRNTIIFKDF